MQQAQIAEALAVVATIDPATVANTIAYTDVVNMGLHQQVMAVCALGNMAAETIDFGAFACDANGDNPVAITGRAATQLAAHATNNDARQLIINLRDTDLNADGRQYVKFGLVTGGATGGPAGVVVLASPRQGLAADVDLATVVEIVG